MALQNHKHVYQPSARAGAPVLVLLHGTGGDERSLLHVAPGVLPQAHVLSPLGNVDENSAARFFQRFPEGGFDIPDLLRRTDDLAAFLQAARAQYGLGNAPMIVLGYSNGANIASTLALRHPGLMRAGLLLRPQVVWKPEQLPSLAGTDLLLHFGRRDGITPEGDAERLTMLLRETGARVVRNDLPVGHGLTRHDIQLAGAFVREVLQGVPLGDAATV